MIVCRHWDNGCQMWRCFVQKANHQHGNQWRGFCLENQIRTKGEKEFQRVPLDELPKATSTWVWNWNSCRIMVLTDFKTARWSGLVSSKGMRVRSRRDSPRRVTRTTSLAQRLNFFSWFTSNSAPLLRFNSLVSIEVIVQYLVPVWDSFSNKYCAIFSVNTGYKHHFNEDTYQNRRSSWGSGCAKGFLQGSVWFGVAVAITSRLIHPCIPRNWQCRTTTWSVTQMQAPPSRSV